MSSTIFVVGLNDNGSYYEVVHIDSCEKGQLIGTRRRYFDDFEVALDKATEQRAGDCCKRKIEQELGRRVP